VQRPVYRTGGKPENAGRVCLSRAQGPGRWRTWLDWGLPDLDTINGNYNRPPPGTVISSDRFDIDARAGDANATPDQMRSMLQALLTDRFQLKIHREMRLESVFELVPTKNGPKLRTAGQGCGPSANCGTVKRTLMKSGVHDTAHNLSMARFTEHLMDLTDSGIDRPVLDKAGLDGSYDFTLDFSPGSAYDGPSIFTALQEQLGLKLESTKGTVEILVIDQVAHLSAN
jgi:uncharacterized protein (TIGR03435 family)